MPIKKPSSNVSGLEEVIDDLLGELKVTSVEDDRYPEMTEQLSKLYQLKQLDKPERVKPDTLLVVAGNIAVAAMIIGFEQKHVVTTKVMSFLTKPRCSIRHLTRPSTWKACKNVKNSYTPSTFWAFTKAIYFCS